MIDYKKGINSNNFNNLILSKDAINFLNNINIEDIEGEKVEINFLFKINYIIIKRIENWFRCSLSDQESKFDGFYIKYQNGEPKKGDIILINRIQIFKLPNRNENLYFCEDVKRIEEENELKIYQKEIEKNNYEKALSKDNSNNCELFENCKNDNYSNSGQDNLNYNDLNLAQDNYNNNNGHINISNNNISNNNKSNNNSKANKYTLISNLTLLSNNPIFFLKCKFKSETIKNNYYGYERLLQNYIFYDTKGDEIQAITFEFAEYFNNIINVGSVYEISKTDRIQNSKEYNLTITQSIYKLLFKRNKTKIKKLEDNGEFDNIPNIKQFTQIDKLTKDKINFVVNIKGIILEDRRIIPRSKDNSEIVRYGIIIIGDNTLHRITFKIWENQELKKNFSKGDIIYIYYAKFKEFNKKYELNSILNTEIEICEQEKEKELMDFFLNHPYIDDYIDVNAQYQIN